MTEEISLDPKTFDLVSVLSGRDYPTVEVPVYFNEGIGLEVFQIDQRRANAITEKQLEALEAEYDAVVEKARRERYLVLLKSVPESVRRDVIARLTEEFPPKKDLLGWEELDSRAEDEFSKRMWAVYIQKITDPSGAVSVADEASVNALYAGAPSAVHDAINKGIAELQLGPKSAFERMAKDSNFLSNASPEG